MLEGSIKIPPEPELNQSMKVKGWIYISTLVQSIAVLNWLSWPYPPLQCISSVHGEVLIYANKIPFGENWRENSMPGMHQMQPGK